MRRSAPILAVLAALLCLAAPAAGRAGAAKLPPSTRLVLDNGFEAILIPNSAAPLITSVVVVRAGSLRETPATSGISHMLEHLLFNGTSRRTQEQIYDEQDRYGIINNAHTAATHTAYFVMSTRDQFHRAIDLQADMLLASTIPEEKLAKERGIIANEIAKDRTRDVMVMSDLYASRMYAGGAAALPVIGTPESVGSIPREAILAYYRAWYVPNNMTAVIMGDFDVAEMDPMVRGLFGRAAPGPLPDPPAGDVSAQALRRPHSRRTDGASRMLWIGAPSPGVADDAYATAYLLARLLGEDLAEAVNARLASSGAGGSLLEAAVDLDAFGAFGTFRVRAALDSQLAWDRASDALRQEVLHRVANQGWKQDDLDRIRLAEKAQMIRLWEKPHYFGLDRAPYVAAGGWDLARDFARRLGFVEAGDLKSFRKRLADPASWAVFTVGPDAPPEGDDAGGAPGAADRQPDPTPTARSRALAARWKGAPDPSPLVALPPRSAASGGGVTARLTLDNGLRVTLDVSDDSRVFAAHALVRNRSAAEPRGKEGIAELLHRLAGEGTSRYPGTALADRLRAIGGSLKVADDPSIPYDDIYLSPEYTYIRLEALDEFADEAIALLAGILSEPALPASDDDRALSAAREALLARAREYAASPRDASRLDLMRGLWGAGHPFARPIFGTEESLRSITADDLKTFHASYFSPRNIVVGIATSVRAERILPQISARLGRWGREAAPPAPPVPAAAPETGPRRRRSESASSQAYLRWGRLVTPAPGTEEPIAALAAVLSRRMGDTLREQRGLSYSLGSEAASLGGSVAFTTWMGVVPESVEEARSGMKEMILSLAESPPTQQEVDDAVRSGRLRLLMRGLSRINLAYARCMEDLRREGVRPPAASGPDAAGVSAEKVSAAARALIDPEALDAWVEVVVEPGSP